MILSPVQVFILNEPNPKAEKARKSRLENDFFVLILITV
jgi:hypothetical protein